LHGVNRTAELDEYTIDGDLEHAALVFGHQRLQQVKALSIAN
jgi:hypothetical protein